MSLADPTGGIGFAFGEVLTSTTMTTIATQQVRALDAVNGGSYVTGSNVDLSGLGIYRWLRSDFKSGGAHTVLDGAAFTWEGTTNLPKIGSRTYTVIVPLSAPTRNQDTRFTWDAARGTWVQSSVASGGPAVWHLWGLPNRSTLTSVALRLDGNGGGASHVGEPNYPQLKVFTLSAGATLTQIGSATDVGPFGVYEVTHDLTVSGLSSPVNGTLDYFVEVTGETGGAAVASALQLIQIKATVTCTEIAPG